MRQKDNFMDDEEKVNDLFLLSKWDFLKSYSYVSEEEYENTVNRIQQLIKFRIDQNKRQKAHRKANIEEERKKQMEYYRQNRDKINARRNYLNSLKTKGKKKPSEKQILLEYAILHKEEIDELKAYREYEKRVLYQRLYYYSKTKKKRQEAKLNGK